MKKIAPRVLALVVALSMLLASTAMAAGRNTAVLSIGSFEVTVGEDTISLPVTLSIGGGVDIEGARGYAIANLFTETATAITALGVVENNEVKAYLSGMSYGVSIPLEQVIALIEEKTGVTFEGFIAEAMSSIDAETIAAIAGITESAAALKGVEIDSDALLNALGITLTEQGEATVTLFDVETAANATAIEMKQQTCKEMIDALAALYPALDEYLNELFAMMNQSMAASGKEMTAEEALAAVTVDLSGMIYDAAETGSMADLTMTVAVEEEAIEFPLNIVTLNDEAGAYSMVSTLLDVNGQLVYMDVYRDGYTADGTDFANLSFTAITGDTVELSLSFGTQERADSFSFSTELYADNHGEPVNMGLFYTGNPVVSTEASDSYDGTLCLYGDAKGTPFELTCGTNLTLSNVPDGELLTFAESINPLEADEETMNQFMTDAQNALLQGLGVLMQNSTIASMIISIIQNPAIASIIGGVMGG